MRRLKNSKKQECPATMTVYSLDLFVDYAVASDKWREKKEVINIFIPRKILRLFYLSKSVTSGTTVIRF